MIEEGVAYELAVAGHQSEAATHVHNSGSAVLLVESAEVAVAEAYRIAGVAAESLLPVSHLSMRLPVSETLLSHGSALGRIVCYVRLRALRTCRSREVSKMPRELEITDDGGACVLARE